MLKDRWGNYKILSGNESPDTCFWCGKPTRNRYCSDECRTEYYTRYNGRVARDLCMERANYTCEKCGGKPILYPTREQVTYEKYIDAFEFVDNSTKPYEQEYKKIAYDVVIRKITPTINHKLYRSLKKELDDAYEKAIKEYNDSQLEVHHIVPIKGGDREWNELNASFNLMCLCVKCHKEISKEQVKESK